MRQPVPFGKYVLLERISVGGMAEVFKAKSFGVEGFEKILAIKRILPSLAEDSDFIEMFIDEAKICGQLNHANICQIFELGRVQDSHFIAMEYVWGKDLLQIQNRFRKVRQTMKPEMAAFVAAKLCEGLDYAHKKKDASGRPLGIIHRDISPQNILISYEGELKIIDFGIAKAASRSSKTQAGVLKGKFGYMSPEQVRGLPLDRRSDVFAIGTILYELLTADRLFIGESDFETLEKVRNVDVPAPSKVNPAVPAGLEKIILRALKKEVEDRYQWASEMQEELQAFLMVREPVFTAKQLSSWMREQFAVEMKREQEILDEQRRVGKEVLTAPIAQSFGAAVSMVSATPTPTPIGDLPASSTRVVDDADLVEVNEEPDDGGDFGEKTTVSSPSFGGVAAPAQAAALPEQKTQILSDQAGVAVPAARNGHGGPSAHADELPAQATVILEGGMAAVQVGPLRAGPQAATLMAQPAPILPPRPVMAAHPPTGSHLTPGTGQVGPLPYAPARSTLWKDILIGVGVAAALVLGVLGVRALFGHGPPSGTVVVMAQPASAAEVLVDGKVRGHLAAGKPLTLKHVLAGAHAILVRAADGSEFRQQLTVAAGDVSVLAASLKPPGLGSGTLKLNVRTEGARVYVDGAELTDGAWKSPIPLRADVPHEIRVTKPEREDVKLTIQLKAGEVQTRDIELVPGYGKIEVKSDPPGAEVSVNGHHAGATPLTVPDLDPGKPARVTVRHRGFAAITKYVSFDKGLAQALDLKMVASSDDGFAEGAQPTGPVELAAGKSARPKGAVLADVSVPEPSSEHGREHHARPKAIESKDELAPIKIGAPHEIKEAAHASNQPGYLVANTQPWARVIIDGHDTGKTTPIAPRSKIALKPGKHVVTFVVSGKRFHFDVMIKPGEDTRLIKQLTDTP